jgi:hypothetical protein
VLRGEEEIAAVEPQGVQATGLSEWPLLRSDPSSCSNLHIPSLATACRARAWSYVYTSWPLRPFDAVLVGAVSRAVRSKGGEPVSNASLWQSSVCARNHRFCSMLHAHHHRVTFDAARVKGSPLAPCACRFDRFLVCLVPIGYLRTNRCLSFGFRLSRQPSHASERHALHVQATRRHGRSRCTAPLSARLPVYR